MMAQRVLIRCDASVELGAGHTMRCLAFAEALAWAGWSVTFITRRNTLAVVPALSASGFSIRTIDDEEKVPVDDEIRLVVVDHYGLDADFERTLARPGRTVMVIDDLANRPHVCDILVDSTPFRAPGDYARQVSSSARLLLGPSYVLVRAQWRAARARARARLALGRPVERIIVSMGATDPGDTTSRVVAALASSGFKAHVDVVLGAGAPHRELVGKLIGPRMTLHVDPDDLPALAARADLAIGASGSSSFERATLGLPTVLIPNAGNQRFVAAAFAAIGAAEVLPASLLDDPAALGARIASLAADGARRAAMSQAAAAIADGRGTMRLLVEIGGQIAAKDGAGVRLRLAEPEDETWLLKLQRQPATRRYFRHPSLPDPEQHRTWMARTFDDSRVLLAIVEVDGSPAGMIRLDRKGTNDHKPAFDVSVAIDPIRHRRGIGAATLALVRRLAPGAVLDATVLPANMASLQLFQRAGFHPVGDQLFRSLPS